MICSSLITTHDCFSFIRGKVVDDWSKAQIDNAHDCLYSPGPKIGVFYSTEIYKNVVRNNLDRTRQPKLLATRYNLESFAFVFPQRYFLFETFDRKLQQYLEADLINFYLRPMRAQNNPKKYEKYAESFAVLTLMELEAGFVICIVPLALSLFVFVIEWISTLKNLAVCLFIFETYFAMKKIEEKKCIEFMKMKISAAKVNCCRRD